MPIFELDDASLYEVTVRQVYTQGQVVLNIFHYVRGDEPPEIVITSLNLLQGFRTRWERVANSCQAMNYVTESLRVVQLGMADGVRRRFDELNMGQEGGIDSTVLPPSTAAVIRRRTNFVGRAQRGRWFLCGVPKAFSNGGRLDLAAMGVLAVQDLVDMTSGNLVGANLTEYGVPVLPGAQRIPVEPFTINGYQPVRITGGFVDPILRSQRRRENGVGM